MTKIDTLFMTKTAEKPYPFGAAHAYIVYIRESPPPPPGELNCVENVKIAKPLTLACSGGFFT